MDFWSKELGDPTGTKYVQGRRVDVVSEYPDGLVYYVYPKKKKIT